MIAFEQKGDFKKTEKFLQTVNDMDFDYVLRAYARRGVEALREATPKDTGRTAESWDYEIEKKFGSITINWYNTNVNKGVNIALILQYGHGTGWGAYVKGIDYINPTIRPIFDDISNVLWKEVTHA